jgi:hypothetical protein
MEALLKIRTKDGSDVSKSNFNDVLSNTKKQTKAQKAPKAPKAQKAQKAPKAPKGVSVAKKNGDFAKFTPIKTPTAPAPPAPWEDENTDELASVVDLDDDGKFETENDIYLKQDQEWHELMKDADVINDDAGSEVPDDAGSEVQDDDTSSEANFDDDSSDVSNIDSELEEGDVFYNYTIKEPKAAPKATKIYSGIPIDFDDSDW